MKKQEIHKEYKAKILELFGGIGAARKALDNLFADCKIKTVDYVDILNWAVEAYKRIAPNCYLPQSVIEWNLDVDILIHGSPCQSFSVAGKGLGGVKGSGTQSSLLWETIDIIKNRLNKKPKVIIWENVVGVLNKNHRPVFDDYLETLEKLGYKNQWKILNGIDFGIPQKRRRVFVVSILNDDFALKEYGHFNIEKLELIKTKSLKLFLEDNKKVDKSFYITQKSMINAIKNKKIKIVDNLVQTITTKQMRWNNAGVIKIPVDNFNQDNYIFEPSETNLKLKVAMPKLIDDFPVFIIDDKPYHLRVITPREAWRLMGFTDDDYNKIADLPKSAKYFLAGNTIIVQVLEAIFKKLLYKKK